jgi:hypothetical protein
LRCASHSHDLLDRLLQKIGIILRVLRVRFGLLLDRVLL